MSDLQQLYQQLILDHARRAQGRGLGEPFDTESYQVNPTCGDEVRLRVRVDGSGGDARVVAVTWEGQGCSISQASTSVLTGLVTGRRLSEALAVGERFRELLQGRGAVEPDEEVLGDAVAFAGVAKYPARVKCALLGWMAFADAAVRADAAPGDNGTAGREVAAGQEEDR